MKKNKAIFGLVLFSCLLSILFIIMGPFSKSDDSGSYFSNFKSPANKFDTVREISSARLKSPSKKPPAKIKKNRNNKQLNKNISDLSYLYSLLQKFNESCHKRIKSVFNNKDYIDPEFSLYADKELLIQKVNQVFSNLLISSEASKAFNSLKTNVSESNDPSAPDLWSKALFAIDGCRENEVFYFFQTLFESFRLKRLKEQDVKEINIVLLKNLKRFLAYTPSLSNIFMITNLVKQSASLIAKDQYLKEESRRLFEKIITDMSINISEAVFKDENKIIEESSYFSNYMTQSNEYYHEIERLIEELILTL